MYDVLVCLVPSSAEILIPADQVLTVPLLSVVVAMVPLTARMMLVPLLAAVVVAVVPLLAVVLVLLDLHVYHQPREEKLSAYVASCREIP